jgi:hypothetical protein
MKSDHLCNGGCIDILVYELCGLIEEDIRVVE